VRGKDLILLDRDARITDQIDFLATELAEREANRIDTPQVEPKN
jgi:hypothetical protein